ncbi:TIGR02594 family protein [Rhodopseudomonas sp. B29]|uniref:NlpC/P60 family protein n=1 Tax=Rhodopseudomonas sp. B29 TaxID=95607 RepID=UPI00034BA74C|nr:TIGR02594 family protein [Rhodopseudomonas sp. B29]
MTIAALVAGGPLRMGAQGEAVRQLQLALKAIGYALTGTGYFGPATDTAVETFQRRAGLKVDGEVGPQTASALDRAQTAPAVVQQATPVEVGRPLWLEAGIKLINVKEAPGATDNPEILDWAKEEGGDIAREYKHDSIAWCALFANHILTKVGLKGTETLWALDFAGHWPAVKLPGPAVGAFAPMKRTGGGHIICIVGRDQHGNVMGLGGNQGDKVSIAPFPQSRLNQGFWWPKDVPLPLQIGFASLPLVRSDGRVSSNEA